MSKRELSLDSLGDLDGGIVRLMIDEEIRKVTADLEDRGVEDKLPRTVGIMLSMQIIEDRVVVRVKAEGKIPPRKTRATYAGLRTRQGKHFLEFQSDNPENAEQPTFKEMDNERQTD